MKAIKRYPENDHFHSISINVACKKRMAWVKNFTVFLTIILWRTKPTLPYMMKQTRVPVMLAILQNISWLVDCRKLTRKFFLNISSFTAAPFLEYIILCIFVCATCQQDACSLHCYHHRRLDGVTVYEHSLLYRTNVTW